jgi:glucosamine-phosphate N-acetyltransferase
MWRVIAAVSMLLVGGFNAYFSQRNHRKQGKLCIAGAGPLAGAPHLIVRELEATDLRRGFLELLAELTTVGRIADLDFRKRLRQLRDLGLVKVVVIHDVNDDKVVGAGTLFVEPKFIHHCGSVGHIEDVVVSSSYRGQKLGSTLISTLMATAKSCGCYKVILDCHESNVPFYQKCAMEVKGTQMAAYFNN